MKLITKYDGRIDLEVYQAYCVKSIFKILPLMEEKKEWKRYLEGFLVELSGINNLVEDINYISLMGKLQGLLEFDEHVDDSETQQVFKKIVFDSINLVKSLQPSKRGD